MTNPYGEPGTPPTPPPVIPEYGPPPMPPFGRPAEVPSVPFTDPLTQPTEHTSDEPHFGYPEPYLDDPRRTGTAIAAVVAGLVVAAAGLGIGVLWAHFAPRVGLIKVSPQEFLYADAEPEQAIGADAWFAFLGLGAGLVFTVLAWILLRRYRGVTVMIALILGSLVGAWLAWWLGIRIALSEFEAVRDTVALNTRFNAPLVLRLTDLDRHALWPPKLTGVAAAQALAVAITYTFLAGFSARPTLRPPTTPAHQEPVPVPPETAAPGAVTSEDG